MLTIDSCRLLKGFACVHLFSFTSIAGPTFVFFSFLLIMKNIQFVITSFSLIFVIIKIPRLFFLFSQHAIYIQKKKNHIIYCTRRSHTKLKVETTTNDIYSVLSLLLINSKETNLLFVIFLHIRCPRWMSNVNLLHIFSFNISSAYQWIGYKTE